MVKDSLKHAYGKETHMPDPQPRSPSQKRTISRALKPRIAPTRYQGNETLGHCSGSTQTKVRSSHSLFPRESKLHEFCLIPRKSNKTPKRTPPHQIYKRFRNHYQYTQSHACNTAHLQYFLSLQIALKVSYVHWPRKPTAAPEMQRVHPSVAGTHFKSSGHTQ